MSQVSLSSSMHKMVFCLFGISVDSADISFLLNRILKGFALSNPTLFCLGRVISLAQELLTLYSRCHKPLPAANLFRIYNNRVLPFSWQYTLSNDCLNAPIGKLTADYLKVLTMRAVIVIRWSKGMGLCTASFAPAFNASLALI